MLCLLLPDSALYILRSYCRLALVSHDWNGMVVLVQQAVVQVEGDYATNAMIAEVVTVLADMDDVVDVGTARRLVDSEP